MSACPVAIVCGYDRFSDLHQYAERVAAHLQHGCVGTVVVTGGFTSRHSWHSEAWTMAQVLRDRIPRARVLLEERAMTTLDNLVFAREIVAGGDHGPGFAVYCDHAHRLKARVLSRIVLGRDATVHAIPRRVSWVVYALEPVSIAVEAVCALVPPLRRLLSRVAAAAKAVTNGRRRSAPPAS